LQGVPEDFVAHYDGVDYARFVESELILAEHAHFLGGGDGAFGGLQFSGQDFMNVDLPAPLGPVTA